MGARGHRLEWNIRMLPHSPSSNRRLHPTSQFERLMVFPCNSTNNQVMDRLSFFSDSLCSTDPSRECHAIPLCHVPWRPALARLWRVFQKVPSFGRPNQFVIVLSMHSFRKAKGPVGGPASYPSPDYSRPCIAASGKPNLGGHQATTIFVQDFKDPPESRWGTLDLSDTNIQGNWTK